MLIVVKKLKDRGWRDNEPHFRLEICIQQPISFGRTVNSEIFNCSSSKDCDWCLSSWSDEENSPNDCRASSVVAHRSLRRRIKCRGQILHRTGCDDQRVFNFYCLYLEPLCLWGCMCSLVVWCPWSHQWWTPDKQLTLMPVLIVDEAEESVLTAVWCFTNKSGTVQIHSAKSKKEEEEEEAGAVLPLKPPFSFKFSHSS